MPDFLQILRRSRSLLFALLASGLALGATAEDDPPGRVGRLSWLSGTVYLKDPGTGELSAAPLNQPLTSGDIVTTEANSRAEIQIGAMTLRLDARSRIEFDRIDDEQVRIFLDAGKMIAKLPTDDSRRDFVLETAPGRFIPRDTGIYRFDRDNDSASATSYFGILRFEDSDNTLDIPAGESAHVWSDNGQLRYRMAQGVRDEFTQWSAARDQHPRSTAYSRYVSPEMTGAQDLDTYGDWSETPEYGAVWFPRAVTVDWAPYRTGYWAWVAPWGWTWIGHEPWGFAPFHYGRWVRVRGAWAWVPGTRTVRPVYAPALVAWVGTPGLEISIRTGGAPRVGWFPLAPREVYVPIYRSSRNHVRFVNAPHVPHIRNIDEIVARPHEVMRHTRFVHRDEPRAFSTARPESFQHRRGETRITSNPTGSAEFRDRQAHFSRPSMESRRAPETEPQPRPERKSIQLAPRQEKQTMEIRREPPHPRSESSRPRQQERSFRGEDPRREVVRQPPDRRIESIRSVAQPVNPPASQERPRELSRSPEPRHGIRLESRQMPREERAQPPRTERRENREAHEERRDERRERRQLSSEANRRQ